MEGSLKFYGNTTLMGNSAYQGGGMGIESSVLTCNGTLAINSNRAEDVGGGLDVSFGSAISFYSSAVFIANNAFRGGGIVVYESNLSCHGNITFMENSAVQGGGMEIFDANVTCDSSTLFENNTANSFGGGLLIISTGDYLPALSGNTRSGVSTRIEGAQSYQTFKDLVIFSKNRAEIGGGIMSLQGNLSLLGNILFHNNSALLSGDKSGFGGGIFSYYSTLYLLGETTFSENTALEGGGVYGSKTTTIIDGSMKVVNNAAHVRGGGFYLASGSECWVMENTSLLLTHNHAGQFGGAVYIQDDSFYRCVILNYIYRPNCFL